MDTLTYYLPRMAHSSLVEWLLDVKAGLHQHNNVRIPRACFARLYMDAKRLLTYEYLHSNRKCIHFFHSLWENLCRSTWKSKASLLAWVLRLGIDIPAGKIYGDNFYMCLLFESPLRNNQAAGAESAEIKTVVPSASPSPYIFFLTVTK